MGKMKNYRNGGHRNFQNFPHILKISLDQRLRWVRLFLGVTTLPRWDDEWHIAAANSASPIKGPDGVTPPLKGWKYSTVQWKWKNINGSKFGPSQEEQEPYELDPTLRVVPILLGPWWCEEFTVSAPPDTEVVAEVGRYLGTYRRTAQYSAGHPVGWGC